MFKGLLAFVVLISCSIIAYADVHGSLESAQAAAKKDNKKIVILVTSNSCHWCEKMKKETIATKEVQAKLNSFHYVEVKGGFRVSGVPTTIIQNKDGREIKRQEGMQDASEFLRWLPSDTNMYQEDGVWKYKYGARILTWDGKSWK